jgi:hypothetical protein
MDYSSLDGRDNAGHDTEPLNGPHDPLTCGLGGPEDLCPECRAAQDRAGRDSASPSGAPDFIPSDLHSSVPDAADPSTARRLPSRPKNTK